MLRKLLAAPRWHLPLLVGLCLLLYWFNLGASGFAASEGHRVIPGWTMLETGNWLKIELFGQTYLRKPPGMPWAVAASAFFFGESEFSARAVSAFSATLGVLLSYLFASRWFGKPWGLAAGVTHVLMPLLFEPARAAEIEALNNLGTQLAAFFLIDLLIWMPTEWRRPTTSNIALSANHLARCAAAALGIVIAVLAKGPAGAHVLIAVVGASCVVARSTRPLVRPGLWISLVLAAAVVAPIALAVLRANSDNPAITQSPVAFLWERHRLLGIATLAPAAFIAALPASLWLLFPWGSDARAEGRGSDQPRFRVARALGFAWVISIAILVISGVSNPRYAMPAAALLPSLAAYVACGCATSDFTPTRRRIARLMCLTTPLQAAVLLLLGLLTWGLYKDDLRDSRGGSLHGQALAHTIKSNAIIWADDLIEARPDILLGAQHRARLDGIRITPLWKKAEMLRAELPPPGALIALRTDAGSTEHERYAHHLAAGRLELIYTTRVSDILSFRTYRALEPASP
ncbi:MAG: glycosyltransferase family 39 protein [Phycisphaerales bacterium]|nr:glycosyltransferase family 39 protein [Phycisphaerales bacterium]